MGAGRIVVLSPVFDQASGFSQIAEQVFVEAFIAQLAVEAFDKGVLGGFTWRNVMPFNTCLLAPLQNRMGGHFSAVIGDNHMWVPTRGDQATQFSGHAVPRQ